MKFLNFVFFLLFVSISFSALSCVNDAAGIIMSEQGINISSALAITVIIIAIAYAFGSAMSNTHYVVFAKDELYHLGFSVGLLACFGLILFATCQTVDFFFQSTFSKLELTSGCFVQNAELNSVANCYMTKVRDDANRLTDFYIRGHISNLMDSTFSVSIQLPLVNSYTATAGAYRRIISNQYDIITNAILVPALVSLSIQKILLSIISENVIRWLLPIAFLLRIFIPTRQMGNILIGLSVGLYVIIPFMYTFNLAMYDTILTDSDYSKFSSALSDPAFSGDCSSSALCAVSDSSWKVAKLIPQAFFLPNLTLAIFMTFITAINKALKVIG